MPTISPRMGVFLAFLAAALAVPATVMAQGQAAGGVIEGTMTDESGAVLPGVAVTVRNQETGVVRETRTDAIGLFRAPLLPVGIYEVTAALQGFATTKRPNLVLNIGQTLSIDLCLEGGGRAGGGHGQRRGAAHRDRPHPAGLYRERALGREPARERSQLHRLRPHDARASPATRAAGDISFAGQRGTLNSLVIDGADNNNTFFGQTLGRTGSGRAPYQFSQDAVQEFQVNRNAYSAEYGRAGGRRHQRGHQVGHQRVPRLRFRVLPRQEPEREQLHEQDGHPDPSAVALPDQPVRRLAGRAPGRRTRRSSSSPTTASAGRSPTTWC